jgi:energy-coupling factor transporter ATP-binding protein EcfA2
MDSVFIERLEARNYGCLYDVGLDLTPLHALVGPNDSGKSTILRVARVLAEILHLASQPNKPGTVLNSGFEPDRSPRLFAKMGSLSVTIEGKARAKWSTAIDLNGRRAAMTGMGDLFGFQFDEDSVPGFMSEFLMLGPLLEGARMLRLDPDSLRQESQLIPESEPVTFYDDRGHQLAGIYDAIQNRGDDSFRNISEQVRGLFPTIKTIKLRNVNQNTKSLELELRDGTRVPAKFASEGLLYYLAFAAVQYLAPSAVVLVEEPENGLHPVRIAQVMRIFREISKTTQVIIATHSPLVVNELSPDEVSVVTRTPEKGTAVRRLSSVPNLAERSKVYALGELWLSYANGVDESDLFATQRSP